VGEYPDSYRDERHFYKTQPHKGWFFCVVEFG
jgi:hypothetical protein